MVAGIMIRDGIRKAFPVGLDRSNVEFLERIKKRTSSEFRGLLDLLGALAVAREPLTEEQLAAIHKSPSRRSLK